MQYIIPQLPDTYAAVKKQLKIDPARVMSASRTRIAKMDKRIEKSMFMPSQRQNG